MIENTANFPQIAEIQGRRSLLQASSPTWSSTAAACAQTSAGQPSVSPQPEAPWCSALSPGCTATSLISNLNLSPSTFFLQISSKSPPEVPGCNGQVQHFSVEHKFPGNPPRNVPRRRLRAAVSEQRQHRQRPLPYASRQPWGCSSTGAANLHFFGQ